MPPVPPEDPIEPPQAGSPQFVDPDPRCLTAGQIPLEDYLRECGYEGIFAIRNLLRSCDWQPFFARYSGLGRPGYHPAGIVGLILLGIMEGKSSLRQIAQLARTDVRAWWLCGGIQPVYSLVGRFILLHQESLGSAFFEDLTRRILRISKSSLNVLSGDGTVIQAAGSRYKTLKLEAAQEAAKEAKAAAKNHATPELVAKAEKAEEVAQAAEERADARAARGRDPKTTLVNATEPEAVVQPHKEGFKAAGYVASALANKDRLIVGIKVNPSGETDAVEPMLDQVERINEGPLQPQVLLDAGYFCLSVLLLSLARNFDLLCPEGKTLGDGDCNKKSSKHFLKNKFRYDEDLDRYLCPAGQTLRPFETGNARGSTPAYVKYGRADCANCPLRAKCLRGNGSRTIKRFVGDDVKEAMRAVMSHPGARKAYSKRKASVEPVFGELKQQQGLRRFRRRGLTTVRLEFALHASAHNMRRYVILLQSGSQGLSGAFWAIILVTSGPSARWTGLKRPPILWLGVVVRWS